LKHVLVPEHRVLSEDDKKKLFEKYHISIFQLPIIKIKDPIVRAMDAKVDDVIHIQREGPSGAYPYFRRVVE